FLFLTGYFFYFIMNKKGRLQHLPRLSLPLVEDLGKASLYVYMAHQPVIYAVLWLVFFVI
ncbi:MAG: hypothetical protein IKU27_00990, partial [Clostridia bacterium]|nr:hypothetical protein [Clostridia bacterium]